MKATTFTLSNQPCFLPERASYSSFFIAWTVCQPARQPPLGKLLVVTSTTKPASKPFSFMYVLLDQLLDWRKLGATGWLLEDFCRRLFNMQEVGLKFVRKSNYIAPVVLNATWNGPKCSKGPTLTRVYGFGPEKQINKTTLTVCCVQRWTWSSSKGFVQVAVLIFQCFVSARQQPTRRGVETDKCHHYTYIRSEEASLLPSPSTSINCLKRAQRLINLEVPFLVRSLKSSNNELGQYLDGRRFKCCLSAAANP